MIDNELINKMYRYFESKETRTEEEQEFYDRLKTTTDVFPITGVTREDLADVGFDVSNVTDEQMDRLADKMCDDYIEQLFWSSMEIIAEDFLEIPKLEDNGGDEEC